MKNLLLLFILSVLFINNIFSQKIPILWYLDLNSISFGDAVIGDIDDDGKLEIVFSTYFNDESIYALNSEDGTILWSFKTNGCNDAAPLILDTDNDGLLEVLLQPSSVNKLYCFNGKDGSMKWQTFAYGSDSPLSAIKQTNGKYYNLYSGDLFGYLSSYNSLDGSLNWRTQADTSISIQTSPVIEDVNNDGKQDCVIASWTYNKNQQNFIRAYSLDNHQEIWTCYVPKDKIYHGATILDLDNDNFKEVIIGSYDGVLYCLNGLDGTIKWTFNFPDYGYIAAPTTVGDLNGDGLYEIVFVSGSKVAVLNNLGKLIWYYDNKNWITAFRGVVLADMDNDNLLDVIFGNTNGNLICLKGIDGSEIFNYYLADDYGKKFEISFAPVIADFNNDGFLDVFVVGGYTEYPAVEKSYGRAYLLTTESRSKNIWPMFRLNERRNPVYPINTTVIKDINLTLNEKLDLYFDNEKLSINSNCVIQSIEVYDLIGNLLIKENYINSKDISLNISKLFNSVYYIKICCNDKIIIRKFIKF